MRAMSALASPIFGIYNEIPFFISAHKLEPIFIGLLHSFPFIKQCGIPHEYQKCSGNKLEESQ